MQEREARLRSELPAAAAASRAPSGHVSRILFPSRGAAIIPLDPKSPSGSSSRPGNGPPKAGEDGRPPFPYLALLRMGFTVPPPLPSGRCALTAPFHPYRLTLERAGRRFLFCGTFLRVTATGYYPACCPFRSSDFPPRSLGAIAWPARSRRHRSMACRGARDVRACRDWSRRRSTASSPRRPSDRRSWPRPTAAAAPRAPRTPPVRSPARPDREPVGKDRGPP